ncbi:hypothetical protein LTR82_003182 [Friedmanniomyces endolithicus]|nr:hypothetical protein LTR82_003182 [Friedmanniomyces endolithicus]
MATNLKAARDIQHGIVDESVVPGTVHMVDLDQTMQAKHSKAHRDIVLVPTPSDDPNDPFNGIANSVVYSVLVPLSEALDLSVGDLNAGTGYLFLLAGWGLLFFQPFAL